VLALFCPARVELLSIQQARAWFAVLVGKAQKFVHFGSKRRPIRILRLSKKD